VHDDDPTYREGSPIDARGRVPVAGADGWRYEPIDRGAPGGEQRITLVRVEDEAKVSFTLPTSSSRATSSARSRCW
jgi:hypothetical protein